jgi:hypothetical protein
MAYRLALPNSLRHMYDVFHVLVLLHYIYDLSLVIDMISLQVPDEGALIEELILILNHRTRQL